MRPAGAAAHDIALFHAVVHIEQATTLTVQAIRSAPETNKRDHHGGNSADDADDPELRGYIAAAMRRTAAVITRSAPPDEHAAEPAQLARALALGRERVRDTVASCEPDGAISIMRDTVPIRALAHMSIWVEVEAARSVGNRRLPAAADGSPDPLVLEIAPEVAASVPPDDTGSRLNRTRRLLQRELGYRSVVLKNSVRAGVALSVAVLLAEVLGVDHGFWVVLATLLVLRSDAYSTSANGLSAVIGTVAGFAVSVGFVEAAGNHKAALWIVFVVAVFLAGYTPGTLDTAFGQGSFAVMVVMLLTITDAPGVSTAVVRLEDVALGAVTAVVLSLLIWPRGARTMVAGTVADAFRAASHATTVFVDCPPKESRKAEQRMSSARRKAEDALDAAMIALGGQIRLGSWMSVLRVVETARALTVGLVPPVRIDDRSGPCADSLSLVRASADRLGARFARIADALDSADAAVLTADGPFNEQTEQAVRSGSSAPEGLLECLELRRRQQPSVHSRSLTPEEDPMYDAVILAGWSWFLEEMEQGLDDASPQILELVAAADPRTWLVGVRT